MSTSYTKCDQTFHNRVRALMGDWHQDLSKAGVKLLCMWASNGHGNAVKCRGRVCYAKVGAIPQMLRAAGLPDAMITFDQDLFDGLSEPQQAAVIDHELQHLEVLHDGGGQYRTDDAMRPVVRLRDHDWEFTGFRAVIQRHGDAAIEAEAMRQMIETDGQLLLQFNKLEARAHLKLAGSA